MASYASKVFGGVTLLALVLLFVGLYRGLLGFSGIVIGAALVIVFWGASVTAKVGKVGVWTGATLVLFHAVLDAGGWYESSFAGVSMDVYAHLLGGFAAALFAASWLRKEGLKGASLYWTAFGLALLLGVGVELVELVDALAFTPSLLSGCQHGACAYWLDTMKDLLHDVLGAAAFLIGYALRRSR